ncbi:hypothetical protein V5O48_014489 [Marasmius crinis-equi]|uniref:DUF6729 domain-containing protein n=1 Tax=Marasmius crinis-equi TaxID=585013 RepID=A0ABR3EX61_9AGAR
MEENSPYQSTTRNTHGGYRAGSGRNRKQRAASNDGPDPTQATRFRSYNPSLSTRNPAASSEGSSVPTFFAERTLQRVSHPSLAAERGNSRDNTQPEPDTLADDNLEHLVSDIREVMDNDEFADIRIEEGRVIEESISDGDEDSMEDNAKAAEKETAESEVKENSVLHQYLIKFCSNIQKEIKKNGRPQCYIDGQFFVHPRHPVFALHDAASTSFSPDPLCLLPVFVWLPNHLPHRPINFKCRCGRRLTSNGYNDNPIARRVRTSTGRDYLLFTNRFICDPRRESEPGCGTSYQGYDPQILDQLPRFVQEAFPAYLTTRSVVDRLVIDQMKACFAGRFGPEPFSRMLREVQMLQHSRCELMYLSAASSYGLSGTKQVPPFPSFNDQAKYAGTTPSLWYLKCIWTDYHAAIKIFLDRIQASLPGFKLSGDHTFAIMKAMARLNSEPIFGALFSVVNEWEEICAQALALTKGFSILPDLFKQISVGLKEHGHQATAVYYTDNPSAERDFHERVTESLKDNVQHVSAHVRPLDMPLFEASCSFEFYNNVITINNACDEILERVGGLEPAQNLVVGLSIRTTTTAPQVLRSIQIRTHNKVLTLEVAQLPSNIFPACLRALLTSPKIVKVGYNIRQSTKTIASVFMMPDLEQMVSLDHLFIDLGKLAKTKGAVTDPSTPLQPLVHAVLQRHLPEATPTQSDEQLRETMALELDCVWAVYISLSQSKSIGLPLNSSTVHIGQLVSLFQSRKPVAEGVVLGHDGTLTAVMDDDGSETKIKITAAYSLIRITKVLVPGSQVSKHKQTIEWISSHGGKAVVQTKSLRSRSITPPLPPDPLSTSALGIPAPPPSSLAECELIINIGPSPALLEGAAAETELDDDQSSESDDESESVRGGASGDVDINQDPDGDKLWDDEDDPEPEPEELVIAAIREAQGMIRQESSAGDRALASRILDDSFHFMDRLLKTLPKKHSAFKEFAHQFSETIFVRDAADVKAVKAVIEKKGLSWDYIVRSKKPWLNRHVRRYIPPPERLEADLRRLFTSFRNIVCSTDRKNNRGRFFSKDSIAAADSLLESVKRGFLSDPPGIALYYIIGWDCDKLPLYRTIRGTNSIEGGVGHFNRTGKKWKSHFDIWLLDEIAELAVTLDTPPSFRPPAMLATRIATSESFFIIPIPDQLAKEYNITTVPSRHIEGLPHHRDTPAHVLTRLSTKVTSPYHYLQLTQKSIYPVVPVHTQAEYTEFKNLIKLDSIRANCAKPPLPSQAWKGINYIKFAKIWNLKVETQGPAVTDPNKRLYYKLPELLLRHHKKVLEWQTSRATMQLGSNASMVQDHLNSLRDPARIAEVLPAVPLSTMDRQTDPTTDGKLSTTSAPQKTLLNASMHIGLRGLDLTSFNPMALTQFDDQGNEYHDAPFQSVQPDTETSLPSASGAQDTTASIPTPNVGQTESQSQSFENCEPRSNPALTTQSLLPIGTASTSAPISEIAETNCVGESSSGKGKKKPKVCAVCTAHKCPRASVCAGKGNRKLCYAGVCKHPNVGGYKNRKRG